MCDLQASKRKARLQSAKKEEEKARLAEVEGLVDMLGRDAGSARKKTTFKIIITILAVQSEKRR